MKINAGSFGTSGSAYFSNDGYLVVDGIRKSNFKPQQIVSIDAESKVETSTSVLSILLGLFIITPILWFVTSFFLLGIIGLILGLWLTFSFSKTKSSQDFARVVFESGESVTLACTPSQVKKLYQFKG